MADEPVIRCPLEHLHSHPQDGPCGFCDGANEVPAGDAKWTTRDKRTMRVRDMADGHLQRCLQFLQRQAIVLKGEHDYKLLAIPMPGGDCDYADEVINSMLEQTDKPWRHFVPAAFEAMEAWAKYKGITWECLTDEQMNAQATIVTCTLMTKEKK